MASALVKVSHSLESSSARRFLVVPDDFMVDPHYPDRRWLLTFPATN
ncbi:MAG: hypothetical protein IJU76_04630 [Desulfovibrionaceae bacterium]|nr:hypothetical protein [Desulfovibrionaceae bacterium]